MAYLIRHKATGLLFCAEPYVVLKNGQELGTWSVVDRKRDATRFEEQSTAVRQGHACGIDGKHWEIIPTTRRSK